MSVFVQSTLFKSLSLQKITQIIIICFASILSGEAYASPWNNRTRETVLFETNGPQINHSIRYDYLIRKNKPILAIQSGGMLAIHQNTLKTGIPVILSWLIPVHRNYKHYIESGTGFNYQFDVRKNKQELKIPLRLGYRFQQPYGGLFFSAGIAPAIQVLENTKSSRGLIFSYQLAIGYTFTHKDCGCN